ncbi:MAG: DUF4038 domain-containing protein [Eubacteriales bacterium]|nr:DUF4038 domain-containing protein [Eubacteriales bacterium]
MKQYEVFELHYCAEKPAVDYVHVNLKATFRCVSEEVIVKGFYTGQNHYCIRFYPRYAETYEILVEGLITDKRIVKCEKADEQHHGMVHSVETHFEYEDGTYYYPFGTTVYGLVHQGKELIDQTMKTLKEAPFNKIRFCVFPKSYTYNHNDPELYAFEGSVDHWNTKRPCFAFWDHLEKRIKELGEMEIQCDLILFHAYDRWGFSRLSEEQIEDYLEYLERRLVAYPNIWWSLANEYDIVDYDISQWERIEEMTAGKDPYRHLLSNHQMAMPWDFSRPNVTHISTQIKNVDNVKMDIIRFQKPLMVDECRYEGNIHLEWGNISGFEMVNRFWKIIAQGGYCTHGETFLNPDEILWWSKGGVLRGTSPKRISFLRDLVESFPGPLSYCGEYLTVEKIRHMLKRTDDEWKKSFEYRYLTRVKPEYAAELTNICADYIAGYKEEVFLKYFERQCTVEGILDLPEAHRYDIELIDIWEMTRKTVRENVSGHVVVNLPGKEGMALLATRRKSI